MRRKRTGEKLQTENIFFFLEERHRALVNCGCRRRQSILGVCLADIGVDWQIDRHLIISKIKREKRMQKWEEERERQRERELMR